MKGISFKFMPRRSNPPKKPKNVRFREDQIEAIKKMEDNENDFSTIVRRAVDALIDSMSGRKGVKAEGQQEEQESEDGQSKGKIGFSKKFGFMSRRNPRGPQ